MTHWAKIAWRPIARLTGRAEASRPDHPSPALRTRFLVMPSRLAWRYVQSCIERLVQQAGWKLEEESPLANQFQLVRRSVWRWFTCDVTVSLWPVDGKLEGIAGGPANRVGVDVTSTSRGGPIDFAQNARNIRDFYRALEIAVQQSPSDIREAAKPGSIRRTKLGNEMTNDKMANDERMTKKQ